MSTKPVCLRSPLPVFLLLALICVGTTWGWAQERFIEYQFLGQTYTKVRPAGMDVAGDHAYVLNCYGDIEVIDVRDPSAMTVAGFLPLRGSTALFSTSRAIAISAGHAYVLNASGSRRGLSVVSLADPIRPAVVATVDGARTATEAIVVGNLLLLSGNSVEIFDISTPVAPKPLGVVDGAFAGWGNGQLFVHKVRQGVWSLDSYTTNEGGGPVRRGQIVKETPIVPPGPGPILIPIRRFGFLRVLDVADPDSPRLTSVSRGVNFLRLPRFSEGHGLLIEHDLRGSSYVLSWDANDLRNPTQLDPGSGGGALAGNGEGLADVRIRQGVVYAAGGDALRAYRPRVFDLPDGKNPDLKFLYPSSDSFSSGISYSEKSVPLRAVSSSGLPIRFRIASGPGRLFQDRLEFTGIGQISVVAEELGDERWLPAAVTNTVRVLANTTLSWATPESRVIALNTPHRESAVSAEGIPATLRVAAGPGRISDGELIITNIGEVTLVAELNSAIWAANPLTRKFNPVEVTFQDLGAFTNPPPALALGVQVRGELAWVAEGTDGIRMVNVADRRRQRTVARIPTRAAVSQMLVRDQIAYVAEGGAGVEIFEWTPGGASARLAFVDTPGQASAVQVADGRMVVADGGDGLAVFDVLDPRNPRLLGRVSTAAPVVDVQIANGHVFAAERQRGVAVYSLADPSAPTPVGRFDLGTTDTDGLLVEGQAMQVAIQRNLACVLDWPVGIRLLDVANPAVPRELGRIEVPGRVTRFAVAGARVALALGTDGIEIWNVADPSRPVREAQLDTGDFANSVAALGNGWLVADRGGGLILVEPAATGWEFISGSGAVEFAGKVKVAGSVAYVANGLAGLKIFDVADPATPLLLAELDTPGNTIALDLEDNRAYLADDSGGLRVVDVSVPSAPVALGHYRAGGPVRSVAVRAGVAWLAAGPGGIETVDVSNPEQPRRLVVFPTAEPITSLAMDGDYVGAVEPRFGLLRFPANAPETLRATTVRQNAVTEVAMGHGWIASYLPATLDRFPTLIRSSTLLPPIVGPQQTLNGLTAMEIGASTMFMGGSASGYGLFATSRIRETNSSPSSFAFFSLGPSNVVRGLTVKDSVAFLALGERGLRTLRVREQISRLAQTLSVPASVDYRPTPISLSVTSSSGLPVVAEVLDGPGRMEEGGLQLTGSGTLRVQLVQAGSEVYLPVTNVANVQVVPNQTLRLISPVASVLQPGIAHPLRMEASSGLPVTFRVLQGPAEIRDGALWITNVGAVTWTAEQMGNTEFSALAVTNTVNPNSSLKLERISSLLIPGSARRIRVRDNLAYVTSEGDSMVICDVGDPANPRKLGQVFTGNGAEEVELMGEVAVVVARSGKLLTINVSDPAKPVKLGELVLPGFPQSVRIREKIALVAASSGGLLLVDLADPANPQLTGQIQTGGTAEVIRLSGSLGGVANGSDLVLLDCRDARNPVELSRVPAAAGAYYWNAEWSGNYLYAATPNHGAMVYDCAEPTRPRWLGQLSEGTVRSVRIVDRTAFLVSTSSLWAFDVSQPENLAPAKVELPFLLLPMDVDAARDVVWVTTQARGLEALRFDAILEDDLKFELPGWLSAASSPWELPAITASGLPAIWSRVSGPVRIADGKLHPLGTGEAVVRVVTAGAGWVRPFSRDIALSIYPAPQAMTLEVEPGPFSLVRPRRIRVTSSSGLPVTVGTSRLADEIRDGYMWPQSSGPLSVNATAAGNEIFAPAYTNWTVIVTLRPEASIRLTPLSLRLSKGASVSGDMCEFSPWETDGIPAPRNWSGKELAQLPAAPTMWGGLVNEGGRSGRVVFPAGNLSERLSTAAAVDLTLPLRWWGESAASSTNSAGAIRLTRSPGQTTGAYLVQLGAAEYSGEWSAETASGFVGYDFENGVLQWELLATGDSPEGPARMAASSFSVPQDGLLQIHGPPEPSPGAGLTPDLAVEAANLAWSPTTQRIEGVLEASLTGNGALPVRARFQASLVAPVDEDRDRIPDLCDREFTVGILAEGRSIQVDWQGMSAILPISAPAGALVRVEQSYDLSNWIPIKYLRGNGGGPVPVARALDYVKPVEASAYWRVVVE